MINEEKIFPNREATNLRIAHELIIGYYYEAMRRQLPTTPMDREDEALLVLECMVETMNKTKAECVILLREYLCDDRILLDA